MLNGIDPDLSSVIIPRATIRERDSGPFFFVAF